VSKTSTLWNLQIYLKRNQRLQHQIQVAALKIFNLKKVKVQDFLNKTTSSFCALYFSPWTILAIQLQLELLINYMENKFNTRKTK
jgi:hypothetical protein